jgi:uncharacterized protein YjiS (DUF1127 family)
MKIKKQANLLTQSALAVDEALDERAKASAAADSDFHRIDRAPTVGSLLRILHGLGTAYRLGRERYRQRRQLMGMDNRELKDIGIFSRTGRGRSTQADLERLVWHEGPLDLVRPHRADRMANFW